MQKAELLDDLTLRVYADECEIASKNARLNDLDRARYIALAAYYAAELERRERKEMKKMETTNKNRAQVVGFAISKDSAWITYHLVRLDPWQTYSARMTSGVEVLTVFTPYDAATAYAVGDVVEVRYNHKWKGYKITKGVKNG